MRKLCFVAKRGLGFVCDSNPRRKVLRVKFKDSFVKVPAKDVEYTTEDFNMGYQFGLSEIDKGKTLDEVIENTNGSIQYKNGIISAFYDYLGE